MSKDDAGGTVETPTVEDLQAKLTASEDAKAKAEAKIVEMKKSTPKEESQKEAPKLSPEEEERNKTKEVLKGMGFTTTEELEDFKKFQSDVLSKDAKIQKDKEFDEFTSKFNTLSDSQKTILRDLSDLHTEKTYDEILKSTNFIDESLLEKSKNTGVVGGDKLGLPAKKEEPQKVSKKVAKKLNIKPTSEIDDIKSKFNL